MNDWPEVIRHGRCGRVLRVHGLRNEVEYLVMARRPEQRRRFGRPEEAIEYLMELEHREQTPEEPEPAAVTEPSSS